MKKHSFKKFAATCASLALSVAAVSAMNAGAAGLAGDANCDNTVNMGDAVLIMQSLANPNKYGLGGTSPMAITENGVKQADIDISTVGITGNDALKIQKYLLKLINILEPS